MELLTRIRNMREQGGVDRSDWELIADTMEDTLGPAEMWNIIRSGFSTDELIENLEYIAREAGL